MLKTQSTKYVAEKGLQILTLDSDFAQSYHNIFRGRITVLLVKANPTSAENIIKILDAALEKIRKTDTQNKLLIITKKENQNNLLTLSLMCWSI